MAPRDGTKLTVKASTTIEKSPPQAEPVPEAFSQRKRPAEGRYRLQVDRQTKSSYATYEAAETAGLIIKKGHPLLQVAIYDGTDSVNKIIELPQA